MLSTIQTKKQNSAGLSILFRTVETKKSDWRCQAQRPKRAIDQKKKESDRPEEKTFFDIAHCLMHQMP